MIYKLKVNPITCEAHGMCVELLGEMMSLDPWGYPILESDTVPRKLLPHAERAVLSCPTLALILERRTRGRVRD